MSNFASRKYLIDVAAFFEDVLCVLVLQKFAQTPALCIQPYYAGKVKTVFSEKGYILELV